MIKYYKAKCSIALAKEVPETETDEETEDSIMNELKAKPEIVSIKQIESVSNEEYKGLLNAKFDNTPKKKTYEEEDDEEDTRNHAQYEYDSSNVPYPR